MMNDVLSWSSRWLCVDLASFIIKLISRGERQQGCSQVLSVAWCHMRLCHHLTIITSTSHWHLASSTTPSLCVTVYRSPLVTGHLTTNFLSSNLNHLIIMQIDVRSVVTQIHKYSIFANLIKQNLSQGLMLIRLAPLLHLFKF